MKQIIVKKPDGGVMIISPNLDKYGDGLKPFSEEKALQKYIDPNHPEFVGVVHDWFIADEKPSKVGLESRKQLYHDGTNEIKKDLNWEVRLMPDHVIKKKYLKKLDDEVGAELAQENPDLTKIFKCQHALEKHKAIEATNQNDDSLWLEKAIEGLDAKVASGEPDKPKIRKILKDKIKQLKKTKGE